MPIYEKRFYMSGYVTLREEADNPLEALAKMDEASGQGLTDEQVKEFVGTLDFMSVDSDVLPQVVDEEPDIDDSIDHYFAEPNTLPE